MRLWSLHPCYLDVKGLVALWREALLAKQVLTGKTKGYLNHPQLMRFKITENPVETINQYLAEIYNESLKRGYSFNENKINYNFTVAELTVTWGQIQYEKKHLLDKLQKRDKVKFMQLKNIIKIKPHPLFKIIDGNIETWEKIL